VKYDCSIGGMSFLFGTNPQNPYRRETADFRRQRIDQEREVGEQSLDSGYWLRSQASFHMGAGIVSTEPLSVPAEEARFRFTASQGIDPWTPGELKLLHDTALAQPGTSASQGCLGVSDDTVLFFEGANLKKVVNSGGTWTPSAVTTDLSNDPVTMTTNGADVFIACSDEISKATVSGLTFGVIYNADPSSSISFVRWLKQRLIVADTNELIEITDTSPVSPPAALPSGFYAHPATDWVWSDAAEGPEAIYVSGYAADTSGIYSIGLTENAGAYDLGTPTLVVDMPRGERVLSLYSYIGTYLIVGTNKGVRVAQIRDGGTLVLGPLVIEADAGSVDAVAQGRYVWVTVGGADTNLWRIDLGQPLNGDLKFASASDLHHTDSGTVTSVTTAGGTLFFTVGTVGLVREDTSKYVEAGWLETGRIRMGTLQPKVWLDATLSRVPDSNYVDSMEARLYTSSESDGPWTSVTALGPSTPVADKSSTGDITSPAEGPDLYVRITLVPTLSGAEIQEHTPVVTGYQVSSIPAPARSRLIQVPIQVWDWERDRNGKVAGRDGYAWERLSVLEAMESDAAVVPYVDFTTGESGNAYIERVTFTRVTPPFRGEDNAGGVATVLMRLLG
jgi:hypothetical protein